MPDAVEDTAVDAAGGGGCCKVADPPDIIFCWIVDKQQHCERCWEGRRCASTTIAIVAAEVCRQG